MFTATCKVCTYCRTTYVPGLYMLLASFSNWRMWENEKIKNSRPVRLHSIAVWRWWLIRWNSKGFSKSDTVSFPLDKARTPADPEPVSAHMSSFKLFLAFCPYVQVSVKDTYLYINRWRRISVFQEYKTSWWDFLTLNRVNVYIEYIFILLVALSI